MKVQLFGAAKTVTGSCFCIETDNVRFAVDCGMHQGSADIEKRNTRSGIYKAKGLDFILLTHAHIDHSGLLPRLVKEGFSGPVYCTEPTRALLGLMLLDSAHIQEMEANWATRKQQRKGLGPVEPLYAANDADDAVRLLQSVTYNTMFSPAQGVRVTYRDAGHILGSSFLELEIEEAEGVTRVVFSGDLGRANSLLVEDPSTPLVKPDYLFLESTYGDRNHKDQSSSLQELAEAVAYSSERGEKAIIPAFAVERTQEVLYSLHLLYKAGKLPNIPVYVDSPLAIRATEIFRRHSTYFDKDAIALIEAGEDPLSVPNLKYTLTTEESKAINERGGPAIIISAGGMCNAGRIKHHLRHNLWRSGASVIFVGYQGIGTPGRKIVDGAERIFINGEDILVAAKIFTIGGFSAHAGQSGLLEWAGSMLHPDLTIFLIHGEEKAQKKLSALLKETYQAKVNVPGYLEELMLAPGKEVMVQANAALEPHTIDWDTLLKDTEANAAKLRSLPKASNGMSWAEQAELREQILDVNNKITRLLAQR